jgi:hypothetical protein
MIHTVRITETLSRDIEVEATDERDALERVREQYDAEEIVLGDADFCDRTFETV